METLKEAKTTLAFLERNFALVKRYLGWEIVFITYSIVNSLCILFIGVTQGKDMVLYLAVGAIVWGFLAVLFHEISESVAWERWEGTIEYTFMAPVRRFTYLFGSCFFAVGYGILRSAILLSCIVLFFGLSLGNANLFAAFVILLVSGLSFIGLGLVAAVLPLLSTERGAYATHIFEAALLLISGIYYEIDVLPRWLRPLSVISPATYTLRSMRKAILEGSSLQELWPTIVFLLAVGMLLIPGGLFIFHQAEMHAKRAGKLTRGG